MKKTFEQTDKVFCGHPLFEKHQEFLSPGKITFIISRENSILNKIIGVLDKYSAYSSENNRISIITNENTLSNSLSAIDNIAFAGVLQGLSYEEAFLRSLILLQMAGLGYINIYSTPDQLPGGSFNVLKICQGLVSDFDLLLYQHPDRKLDRKTSKSQMGLLSNIFRKHLKSDNDQILISTGDVDSVLLFGDRIIIENSYDPEKITCYEKQIGATKNKQEFNFKHAISKYFSNNKHAGALFREIRDSLIGASSSDYHNQIPTQPCQKRQLEYVSVNNLLNALYIVLKGEGVKATIKATINDEMIFDKLVKLHHEFKYQIDKSYNFFKDDFFAFFDKLLSMEKPDISPENENHDKNNISWKKKGDESASILSNNELKKELARISSGECENDINSSETEIQIKFKASSLKPFCIQRYYSAFLFFVNQLSFRSVHDRLTKKTIFKKLSNCILTRNDLRIDLWKNILFFTVFFLLLGFSNGALKYLKDQMLDPFLLYVEIMTNHSANRGNSLTSIQDLFKDKDLLDKYHLSGIYGDQKLGIEFLSGGNSNSIEIGRTIDKENPTYQKILEYRNFEYGNQKGFNGDNDFGIIVTKNLLNKLGLRPEETRYLKAKVHKNDWDSLYIPIAVRTVVDKLPQSLDFETTFITTKYLFSNLISNYYFNDLIRDDQLVIFIDSEDSLVANMVLNEVVGFLKKDSIEFNTGYGKYRSGYITSGPGYDTSYNKAGYRLKINFLPPAPDCNAINKIFTALQSSTDIDKYNVDLLFEFQTLPMSYFNDPLPIDLYTFCFYDLDRYDIFVEEILKPNWRTVRYDNSKVRSYYNYRLISKLTHVLTIFMIVLFLILMAKLSLKSLRIQLNKITRGITSIPAVPQTNVITNWKRKAIWAYMLAIVLSSFVLAVILGYSGLFSGMATLLNINITDNFEPDNYLEYVIYSEKLFDIFSYYTLISIVMIALIVHFESFRKLKTAIFGKRKKPQNSNTSKS